MLELKPCPRCGSKEHSLLGGHNVKRLASKAKSEAIIRMKKKDFVKEHVGLIKKLETGKGLKKEAKEQSRELKRYTRKN